MAHGEIDYCPICGKEVYSHQKPCQRCGYDGRSVTINLSIKQLDMLLSNRVSQMEEVLEFIRRNVVEK